MTYWNYRVMATKYKNETTFSINEVHYENDIPVLYSENPASVHSGKIENLKGMISKMKSSLDKPVLWSGEKFPTEYLKD